MSPSRASAEVEEKLEEEDPTVLTVRTPEGRPRTPQTKPAAMSSSSTEGRPPSGCAPVWMRSGEYRLAPKWRTWALQHLHVPPSCVAVDLFGRGQTACSFYIDKIMDAFSFNWSAFWNKKTKSCGPTRHSPCWRGFWPRFLKSPVVWLFAARSGPKPSGGKPCKPSRRHKCTCQNTRVSSSEASKNTFFLRRNGDVWCAWWTQ